MKKKGFTLIELLAVIVILAIIALIATPIILNMINNARKSAARSSAYGYIEAIDGNNGFADAEVEGYTKIEDGTHNVSDITVKMKGKAPESGTVKIVNGKVSEANICIGGYTVTYNITTSKEAQVGNKCSSSETSTPAQPTSPVTIVSGTGTSVGDEVAVGDEHFYVVSNNGTKAVLLAKYNLNVGANKVAADTEGLQSVNATGYVSGGSSPYPGAVAFSGTNYWSSETTYPKTVYDSTKKDASGTNYSIAYYVENYKATLEGLGLTVNNARLITYEELTSTSIGCNASSLTCSSAPSWVRSTTYWSGSASSTNRVWRVDSDGSFSDSSYNNFIISRGVRPVIEISSSLIQAS